MCACVARQKLKSSLRKISATKKYTEQQANGIFQYDQLSVQQQQSFSFSYYATANELLRVRPNKTANGNYQLRKSNNNKETATLTARCSKLM